MEGRKRPRLELESENEDWGDDFTAEEFDFFQSQLAVCDTNGPSTSENKAGCSYWNGTQNQLKEDDYINEIERLKDQQFCQEGQIRMLQTSLAERNKELDKERLLRQEELDRCLKEQNDLFTKKLHEITAELQFKEQEVRAAQDKVQQLEHKIIKGSPEKLRNPQNRFIREDKRSIVENSAQTDGLFKPRRRAVLSLSDSQGYVPDRLFVGEMICESVMVGSSSEFRLPSLVDDLYKYSVAVKESSSSSTEALHEARIRAIQAALHMEQLLAFPSVQKKVEEQIKEDLNSEQINPNNLLKILAHSVEPVLVEGCVQNKDVIEGTLKVFLKITQCCRNLDCSRLPLLFSVQTIQSLLSGKCSRLTATLMMQILSRTAHTSNISRIFAHSDNCIWESLSQLLESSPEILHLTQTSVVILIATSGNESESFQNITSCHCFLQVVSYLIHGLRKELNENISPSSVYIIVNCLCSVASHVSHHQCDVCSLVQRCKAYPQLLNIVDKIQNLWEFTVDEREDIGAESIPDQ